MSHKFIIQFLTKLLSQSSQFHKWTYTFMYI